MKQEILLKKAEKWARILGHCPGVRAIFLSGSLAQGRAHETSDIDFFIVARHGMIWTARFFVFGLLKLCGQMRSNKKFEQKICPNHFISDQALEIQEKDAYSAHLFSHNKPLYDPHGLFPLFSEANQGWVKTFGESFPDTEATSSKPSPTPPSVLQQAFEQRLKRAQTKKIRSNPESYWVGSKIVLSDTELRFHPKPKNRTWPSS